jgi:integrase
MAGTKARTQSEAMKTERVKMPPNITPLPNGGLQFRKVIPKDVRHIVGFSEFKRSLGHDLRLAMLEAKKLEAEVSKLIYDARQGVSADQAIDNYLKKGAPRTHLRGDSPTLAGHAAALFLVGVHRDQERRRTGELTGAEFHKLGAKLLAMHKDVKYVLATGDSEKYKIAVQELFIGQGYLVDATNEQWQTLLYDFAKAIKPAIEEMLRRQEGEISDYDTSRFDAMDPGPVWLKNLTPKEDTTKPQDGPARLSAIIPDYQDDLKKSVDHGTQTTRLYWWQLLIDFTGDMKFIDVDTKTLYDFFKVRIDASTKDNWKMKTAAKVKREFSRVFSLANSLRHYKAVYNPATALENMPKISRADEKSREQPILPYEMDKLTTLFASPWYGSGSEAFSERMMWDLGARYWVPLIALYHGFRVREAAQLCVHDISVIDEHPMLTIQLGLKPLAPGANPMPERSIKNESGFRTIPVHPKLVELGFMDLVGEAKARGAYSPLFPSSLPDLSRIKTPVKTEGKEIDSKWGRSFEQKYLRYVKSELGFESGYGSHSFRHTLEDALRHAQLDGQWPGGVGQFYSGRALPSDKDLGFFKQMGSERLYGKGFNPSPLIPFVTKIQYPEVRHPRPYKEWLNGRQSVNTKLIAMLNRDYGSAWK